MDRSRSFTLGYENRGFYPLVGSAVGGLIIASVGVALAVGQRPLFAWLVGLVAVGALLALAVWHLARTRVTVSEAGIEIRRHGLLGPGHSVTRTELLGGLVMPDSPTVRVELLFHHDQAVILGPFDPLSRRVVEREVDALASVLSGQGLTMSDLRQPLPPD